MAAEKLTMSAPFALISPAKYNAKLEDGLLAKGGQRIVNEMIFIHNVLIRHLNAIYTQCQNIPEQDAADFVDYCATWGKFVHHHHQNEEVDIFPGIDKVAGKEDVMGHEIEEHHSFTPGLELYEAYLQEVKDGKQKYDGQKLSTLIDAFSSGLYTHLVNEISTLQTLDQHKEAADWEKFWDKITEGLVAHMKADKEIKEVFLPFTVVGHDRGYEGGYFQAWPPAPWIVKLLIRWTVMPIHKKWWRFAPCDYRGQLQPLPFGKGPVTAAAPEGNSFGAVSYVKPVV